MKTRRCSVNQAAGLIAGLVRPVEGRPFLAAIDGRCGSGKSTLAGQIVQNTGWGLVHMDDFFPRPEQRTPARLSEPGGNLDRERFLEEVLMPLRRGERGFYRPYDCHSQRLREAVALPEEKVVVVEGSYSCHPELRGLYDLRVFLTVEEGEQLRRIGRRNGAEGLKIFRERWIPMEERYFHAFEVWNSCELILELETEPRA